MRRVRSQDRLQGFDPEPERTFHRRQREARDTYNLQALVQFSVDMAEEQHMSVQEVAMPSIANVTSSIVKPRITGHFELKHSMIQLLRMVSEEKRWLKAKPANSITSWNDLASLGRFKGMLRDCPHHNHTNEVLAHTFIEGLQPETNIVVDAAVGGQVLEKNFDEIYALLNKFSKSNPDWQGEMGRHTVQESVGVLELNVVSALLAQVATLANQVNKMTLVINKQQAQPVQQVQIFCEVCGEGHTSDLCPVNSESVYFVGNANKVQTNQYGNTNNPNSRNHPNFSWGGNQGAQNQYRPQAQAAAHATAIRNLERQVGQLASTQNTRSVGAHPSDAEANPKASINVLSLRNGRQLEEVPPKKRKQVTFTKKPATIETESEKAKESEKPVEEAVAKQPPPLVAKPPPPFPRRLHKVKDNVAYKKFLNILKQVQINIPLVDILQEVPKDAKYIKDIVANKRRLIEFETVALTEECSSRIQSMLA
uniref:Retrotransposon gag protein n=1 Tax=Nicotiana tabacum TaxID=4097 RepID=A0A1S4A657_TOBAC|nr:PREDICTED: uncharacterized protein LOC107794148 [Nicotiana tabacum]